jgi:hypothetical protein
MGRKWFRVMDTSPSMESFANFVAAGTEEPLTNVSYKLGLRAVLLAIAR